MTKAQYKQQALDYWYGSSEDDWDTALKLQENKKYHHALFFGHLSLEKLFKGKIVEILDRHPLPVHDLILLSTKIECELSLEQKDELKEITSFNLEARYDSYKLKFYKKVNKNFCITWMKVIERWRLWIKDYSK
ncbi:HEPN domain-containing protein [Patescibacteria group bacterium]|nr:HEPN domain-containing protein [Patescibacteria group bacterium]